MIRSVIGIMIVTAAVVWLPVWLQAVLFVLGAAFLPYRLGLFVPAALADALYAPGAVGIAHLKYTLFVAGLLLVHWMLVTKTRAGDFYAMEKK